MTCSIGKKLAYALAGGVLMLVPEMACADFVGTIVTTSHVTAKVQEHRIYAKALPNKTGALRMAIGAAGGKGFGPKRGTGGSGNEEVIFRGDTKTFYFVHHDDKATDRMTEAEAAQFRSRMGGMGMPMGGGGSMPPSMPGGPGTAGAIPGLPPGMELPPEAMEAIRNAQRQAAERHQGMGGPAPGMGFPQGSKPPQLVDTGKSETVKISGTNVKCRLFQKGERYLCAANPSDFRSSADLIAGFTAMSDFVSKSFGNGQSPMDDFLIKVDGKDHVTVMSREMRNGKPYETTVLKTAEDAKVDFTKTFSPPDYPVKSMFAR
ncbi:MAG: hypothetical protein GEU76_01870 [Alphaproteobacteria bacterium]|nr:hypothetical protein [Alphaproteobacteria bacterium]